MADFWDFFRKMRFPIKSIKNKTHHTNPHLVLLQVCTGGQGGADNHNADVGKKVYKTVSGTTKGQKAIKLPPKTTNAILGANFNGLCLFQETFFLLVLGHNTLFYATGPDVWFLKYDFLGVCVPRLCRK